MTQDDKSIYLIGSLANRNIPNIANLLRVEGYDVFDDWWAPGPHADSYLRNYASIRKLDYRQILNTHAAVHIFNFDKTHLDRCSIAVLVMPAGRSGHLELGYAAGCGKKTFILFDKEPTRVDIMYKFADKLCFSIEELIDELKSL